jgi:hypothetical protein
MSPPGNPPSKRWKDSIDAFDTMMVGTCNGLLCLCDNTRPDGVVSLLNLGASETLVLPPLPGSTYWVTEAIGGAPAPYGSPTPSPLEPLL